MSDVLDHFYAGLTLIDSMLQFWVSITFAVIVAVHFVGDRLGRQMYLLLTGLYALVSVVSLARYIGAAIQIAHYLKMLTAEREWPVPFAVSAVSGFGTGLLLIFGSVGTLYFMYSVRKSGARRGA
jgi:hypothetical protein